MSDTLHKFSLTNSQGSIVEIDTLKQEVRFFRDPWGPDSSNMPDEVFSFAKINQQPAFLELIKNNSTKIDLEKMNAFIGI